MTEFSQQMWALSYVEGMDETTYRCKIETNGITCGAVFKLKSKNQYAGALKPHLIKVHQCDFIAWKEDQLQKLRKLDAMLSARPAEDDVKIVCWASRHGIPLAALGDPDFQAVQNGQCARLTRATVRDRYQKVSNHLLSLAFDRWKGRYVSLAFDGGTTQSLHVLNCVVKCGNRVDPLGLAPYDDQSTENMVRLMEGFMASPV